MYISEDYVWYSDNPEGLNITVFLVDRSKVNRIRVPVNSDKYDVNKTVTSNSFSIEERVPVPQNYFNSDPMYLVEGSIITLDCYIKLHTTTGKLITAKVYVFTSHNKSLEYADHHEELGDDIYHFDVTDCVLKYCKQEYTVKEESFYFFVLTTRASSSLDATTKFSFQAIQYANSSLQPGSLVVATISANESAFVPLHCSKLILMDVQLPENYYSGGRIGHLNFNSHKSTLIGISVIVGFTLSPAILTWVFVGMIFCCRCCYRKARLNCRRRTEGRSDETVSLLSHNSIN